MRALVYHGPRNVSVEEVPDARIEKPADALHHDRLNPGLIVSHELNLDDAAECYQRFDDREDGWTKVVLHP